MMAMLTSSKVREQLKKVSEAMQTSGIDMASLKVRSYCSIPQ